MGIKKVEGFKEPNYTQIPNDVFELLPEFGDAELRILLAICRLTFGFHRYRCRASISKLQQMTGLSRQGVVNAIKIAEERGLITKIPQIKRGVNEWVVNVVDHQLVNLVDQGSQRGRLPSIKERVKKKKNNINKYNDSKFSEFIE